MFTVNETHGNYQLIGHRTYISNLAQTFHSYFIFKGHDQVATCKRPVSTLDKELDTRALRSAYA